MGFAQGTLWDADFWGGPLWIDDGRGPISGGLQLPGSGDAGEPAAATARKTAATGERKRARLLARLDEDERRAGDPATWRRWGDLLATQPALPPIDADGFADVETPAGDHERVPLDPGLSLSENIALLHKKAKRAESARVHIADRRAALLESPTPEPAPARPAPAPENRHPTTDLPHGHVFRFPDGSLVLVGRSATENERITFGFARGEDEWLHARDVPGSHVVVRLAASAGAAAVRQDAARLALHYSFKRGERAGDVQCTQRKYVQRIKGAPGKVRITREENLRVEVTPEDMARIEGYRLKRS